MGRRASRWGDADEVELLEDVRVGEGIVEAGRVQGEAVEKDDAGVLGVTGCVCADEGAILGRDELSGRDGGGGHQKGVCDRRRRCFSRGIDGGGRTQRLLRSVPQIGCKAQEWNVRTFDSTALVVIVSGESMQGVAHT